jgi:hypothetical protein
MSPNAPICEATHVQCTCTHQCCIISSLAETPEYTKKNNVRTSISRKLQLFLHQTIVARVLLMLLLLLLLLLWKKMQLPDWGCRHPS